VCFIGKVEDDFYDPKVGPGEKQEISNEILPPLLAIQIFYAKYLLECEIKGIYCQIVVKKNGLMTISSELK
jgi:hypothetical protein